MKQCFEHVIREVLPDSIAEELEIEPGDALLEINGQKIKDVFDYRFLIKDEYIEVLIRKPDGEEWLLEIDKEFDDDLGIEFENGLMSEYKSCTNKCIFCFIDQMPPGMRETLYFKDDDSRLSFLQGNYITMTNMTDEDFDRIIRMQLAPINISVQTTNPELRCKMLNNRFAGEKLKYLDKLYEGRVEMNGQIVCCKGVNDGEELRRSIGDLMKYLPFIRSVSVVPAGITKYREGLYPLELFTKEEAEQIIDMIESYQKECYETYGLHFIHASDEWYILAQRPFPEEERYDGYIQLENGVGMMRLFMAEFEEVWQNLLADEVACSNLAQRKRSVTIATGRLAYPTLRDFAETITARFSNIRVQVVAIRNDFFGETITVSGLVTGQDLVAQLSELKRSGGADAQGSAGQSVSHEQPGSAGQPGGGLGDAVLIPSGMLRSGEQVFLDDMTVSEVSEKLGVEVKATECEGSHFLEAILNPDYEMTRKNENFVYVKAYDH